jgi:hypothetical protein
VTAYRADGGLVATTAAGPDGSYQLDSVPAEPLTLVAVEHPVVNETVTVGAGLAERHDIALAAEHVVRRDL